MTRSQNIENYTKELLCKRSLLNTHGLLGLKCSGFRGAPKVLWAQKCVTKVVLLNDVLDFTLFDLIVKYCDKCNSQV